MKLNKQPESTEHVSIKSMFSNQDVTEIALLYGGVSDRFGGVIQVAPRDTRGGPDWNKARAGEFESPSHHAVPATFEEVERWCVRAEKLPGCSTESSFLIYFDPPRAGTEAPFIFQLSGPVVDAGIGKAILYRDIGLGDALRCEPTLLGVVPTPANDNEPPEVRALPVAPSMCADPLSPAAAGGLLGDIATWITSTAIVPVPELSMISAIALVAGMFGNRLLGPTWSGLHLYLTTLMGTAGGKGHPPKAIRKLAELSGKPGAVTNGDHTSYAALERTLRHNPSTVITMDEFGITLQDVNGRHTSSPAASIRKFLLAVYDQADSIFDGRKYASDESKKDDSPIVGPALTVLGITTPETLFAGLSEASISDGFINRFLFVTGAAPKIIRPPKLLQDDQVPKALITALKDAHAACPLGNGLGKKYIVPIDGGEDGAAYRRWLDVFYWQHSPAWTPTEQGINGRAAENTIKLATIRAVSRNAAQPMVSLEDVEWGWAIVHASINLVTSGAEKHMSASPAEALRKAIVAALAEAPNKTLAFSKLLERRGVRGAQHYELEGALKWLTEAERILDLSGKKLPGKGSKLVLTP